MGKLTNIYIFIASQIIMLLAVAGYWLELADTIDAEGVPQRIVKHALILLKQVFIPK